VVPSQIYINLGLHRITPGHVLNGTLNPHTTIPPFIFLLQTVSFALPQSIIPTSSSRPYLPLLQHHVPHLIFAHSLPTNMQDVILTIVVLLSRVSLLSRSTCHDTVDGGPSTNPSSTNERGDSSATSVPLSQRTYIRSLLSVELEAKTARPTLPSPHYWFISSWRRSACVHGSSMGTDCTETGVQLIELFCLRHGPINRGRRQGPGGVRDGKPPCA
jgi:hypothetical protein